MMRQFNPAFTCSWAILIAVAASSITYPPKPLDASSVESACNTNDAEALLACGKHIQLIDATQADLEMIPGISTSISEAIIEHKIEILRKCSQLPWPIRYLALINIKGVSQQKAVKIAELLDVC